MGLVFPHPHRAASVRTGPFLCLGPLRLLHHALLRAYQIVRFRHALHPSAPGRLVPALSVFIRISHSAQLAVFCSCINYNIFNAVLIETDHLAKKQKGVLQDMYQYYTDPNQFDAPSDSQRIQMAVNEAAANGCGKVLIPAYNKRTGTNLWEIGETIELPSHIYVEINHAHLRMKDGVFCQMFRNSNAFLEEGRTPDGLQEDIIIQGVGRALLDGGTHNGLRERGPRLPGMPPIVHNLTIYMHHVRNFKIDGLTIRDQRWYGMGFAFAWEGVISNIRFEITDKSSRTSQTHPWRNQDGVDLRLGCHDIQIQNLTGETCDDVVALTALSDPDLPNFETRSACPHLPCDIYNVSIRSITAFNNHCALVRLPCHNGKQIYNISIDNLIDTTPDDTPTEVENGIRTACCVNIGENDYYHNDLSKRCSHGDMRNISVSNIFSSARCAVDLNCSVKDLIVRNVFVGKMGCHALAVSKIKFGIYDEQNNPVNVTFAENVLVDGIRYASQRADGVPFYFDALVAKNFVVRNVAVTGTQKLVEDRRHQAGTQAVVFENVVMD